MSRPLGFFAIVLILLGGLCLNALAAWTLADQADFPAATKWFCDFVGASTGPEPGKAIPFPDQPGLASDLPKYSAVEIARPASRESVRPTDHRFMDELLATKPADYFAAPFAFRPSSTSAAISDLAGGIRSYSVAATVAINSAKSSGVQAIPRAQIAAPTGTDATWIGPSFSQWTIANNWSPAVVPNGAGVTADFRPTAAGNPIFTTDDVSTGLVLGRLTLAGTGAQSWNVGLSNTLTFDNNGNGAVVSNVNTAVGNYQLQIAGSSVPITLADNLTITNTSGSTNPGGSISITEWFVGTGNLTFNNVSNNPIVGQISLAPFVPSTFLGTSTIVSGAVSFGRATAFGASGNQVILGSAGGGSATLTMFGGAGFTFSNPILVASGSGGTLALGGSTASTTDAVFSGSITLNGDVSLTSNNTTPGRTVFSNTISGAGGITKVGAGEVLLTGNNTFTGATIINSATLTAGGTHALGSTASITVNSGGTLLLGGSTNNRINDTAPLNLNGNGAGVVSFQTAGLSEHGANNNSPGIGPVTLQSSSIIDLGNGASIIAFANSSTQTWTGTLKIYNWSGTSITGNGTDQVYFGTDVTGLTVAQLTSINFYSDSGSTFLGFGSWGTDLDGEIVPTLEPIPEPATWIGGALTLAAIGIAARRRVRA
jgi:autotransporter-associated beta strand protein